MHGLKLRAELVVNVCKLTCSPTIHEFNVQTFGLGKVKFWIKLFD